MDYEYENQNISNDIIDYIDNLDFSNSSQSQSVLAPVNRNITKNIISTFFLRFKNEKQFSKMKIKIFNKKLEKIYNIMLGVIIKYIKYIPNTSKNINDSYVIYDDNKKLTSYNIISDTMFLSKSIHDNMFELFVCNKNTQNNKTVITINKNYNEFFYKILYDVLEISDFKFDKSLLNENNFNLGFNTILKLISCYCIKNNCYDKTLYPYQINSNVSYKDIKIITFNKLPHYHIIFEKMYSLIVENNESVLKTFILLMREGNKNVILIPKSYQNHTKISFNYIEIIDDNIYTSEAKLDITKLRDQVNNIYIKIFGFSTIVRFLIEKENNNYNENTINKLTKIIEKTQEKLKNK